MACVTACPSGVRYDEVIEDTRAQIERNWERPARERITKKAIFETFPHPRRLRPMVPLLAAARARAVTRAARRRSGGLVDRIPGARNVLQLAPEPPPRAAVAR